MKAEAESGSETQTRQCSAEFSRGVMQAAETMPSGYLHSVTAPVSHLPARVHKSRATPPPLPLPVSSSSEGWTVETFYCVCEPESDSV